MTANSPTAIVATFIQYGALSIIVNSKATMKALKTTGKAIANNNHLENIIQRHANAVAKVPNKISSGAVGEKKLAIKHPKINPIAYLLLKKQNKTKISAKRN